MIKLAVYGKGGIGKSTTVSNISAALARGGLRVMQIGCDPKADSTISLHGGQKLNTVLDLVRQHKDAFELKDMVCEGFAGVVCVEAGGPTPGLGCAGRGIIAALEKLEQKGAYEAYKPDVVIYDVLGDVVCGGFTMPMREGYADNVFIITSGENMAIHAAANIAMAVENFRDRGYAELGGEIKPIYVYRPGEVAYFHRSGAPVVLEVRKGFFNDPQYDNDNTATLDLPTVDASIWRAVEKVDAASVDECAFHCVDCLIPSLRDAINDALEDDGLEQVNDFARRLAKRERTWGEAELVRYKALLTAVGQPDLTSAVQLMEEAGQYELHPEVAQTWGYAEMTLREKYPDLPEELFQTPQAVRIGQQLLDDRLGAITEYGLIRRKDGQPLPILHPEQAAEQGLEMM